MRMIRPSKHVYVVIYISKYCCEAAWLYAQPPAFNPNTRHIVAYKPITVHGQHLLPIVFGYKNSNVENHEGRILLIKLGVASFPALSRINVIKRSWLFMTSTKHGVMTPNCCHTGLKHQSSLKNKVVQFCQK